MYLTHSALGQQHAREPHAGGTIEQQRRQRDREASASSRGCSSRRGAGAGPQSIRSGSASLT